MAAELKRVSSNRWRACMEAASWKKSTAEGKPYVDPHVEGKSWARKERKIRRKWASIGGRN
jgi:hypothetical protein